MRAVVRWLTGNWRWTAPVGTVALLLAAWLLFVFFGVHLLFIDEEVDEPLPTFSSGAGASGLPSDATGPDLAEAMNEAMREDKSPLIAEMDESPPEIATSEVLTEARGLFVDRSHPTSGRALVLSDGTDQRFLRFEDFETDNGPDLNVYLSTAAPDAPAGEFDDDFVDLGDLKGNIGPQNYEIPPGVELGRYSTVVIWCVRFRVAFGAAALSLE
jgi:hypothetical protein